MRLHIQNDPTDPVFAFTLGQWQQAAAAAPDAARGHQVTIGASEDDFAAAMAEAEGLVIAQDTLRRLLPLRAPKLRLIHVTSAGLDRVAPYDWLPPGVVLLNNRGAHGEKAGQYALMALLMLAGHIPALMADQHARRWVKRHSPSIVGRRVTVVGLGDLGGAAAGQAARLGMEVTGVSRHGAPHPACARVVASEAIDTVLPGSEFVVLACPLTAATRGLLDRRRLSSLPPGAGVVNIGRGGLIEQDALCDLLDAGHLGGAVLDVFTPEPVPPGHRLWTTRNLVMTPHLSTDDPATYNLVTLGILLRNLRALQTGEPLPNAFDTKRGY